MKRGFDVLVSLVALVLLSPVLLACAIAIVLEGGGPILFSQARVGLGGREFSMYKFRSMVKDAASIGSWQTSVADPRITRVGRFLRRTSLDELPQLFNVLRGDMSVVGPRPDVPAQRSLYSDTEWAARTSVRPGITGLAQALLRSEATESQRRDLDLRYVREHGLMLDLRIIGWTLGRIHGKGSN